MGRQLQTLNEPVPEPNYKLPGYDPITPNLQIEAEQIMYDLMTLALETDSTRVISFFLHGLGQVFSFNGKALGSGYHGLSHHGNNPAMIRDLVTIETAHIHCFAGFLKQLKERVDRCSTTPSSFSARAWVMPAVTAIRIYQLSWRAVASITAVTWQWVLRRMRHLCSAISTSP